LERAADRNGVRLLLLTERERIEGLIEYVTQANSAQMRDPAFVAELKQWIRFNDSQAILTGDGLAAPSSGNPTLPPWLGRPLFSLFFREKSENDRYAKQLRLSSAAAVFVGVRADPASWFGVGRAYEHFVTGRDGSRRLGIQSGKLTSDCRSAAISPNAYRTIIAWH
jgi:hypothetical protein